MDIRKNIIKYFKTSTSLKIRNFIKEEVEKYKKKKINILEFGVDKGISTSLFLKFCEETDSKLNSVDTINYENLFDHKKWSFIHTRDDNFKKIDQVVDWPIDLIFLDTEHTALHVEKIIYLYFGKLKKNGIFLIDDISWLPYSKNQYRDNEWIENNNKDTFEKLLEIYNSNKKNINLKFVFDHSGLAIIKKLSNKKLNIPNKIASRRMGLKNILRKNFK